MDKILSIIGSTTHQILALVLLGVLIVVLQYARKIVPTVLGQYTRPLPKEIEISTEVVEALAGLRALTGAARAYVFQFHNGDYFSNGSSILRQTCTHESVSPGVSSMTRHGRNILVSTVICSVRFLMEHRRADPPVYEETADIDAGFYKNILVSNGVEATIKYPLYRDNDIIGYIGVDFSDAKRQIRTDNPEVDTRYRSDILNKSGQVVTSAAQVEYWVNKGGIPKLRPSILNRLILVTLTAAVHLPR